MLWKHLTLICLTMIFMLVKIASSTNMNSTTTSIGIFASTSDKLSLSKKMNRRPRKKDLNQKELLDILGDSFDSNWMSLEKPVDDMPASYILREDVWPYMQLMHNLQSPNLTKELSDLSALSAKDSNNVMILFKKWLLKRASCPVRYSWVDIGSTFWPRWIRRGECALVPGSCSWPPGMHCVPTHTSTLDILRWQCTRPTKKRKIPLDKRDWKERVAAEFQHLRCQWTHVPYPIISACLCTC